MKKSNIKILSWLVLIFLTVVSAPGVHAAEEESVEGEVTKEYTEYDLQLIQKKNYIIPDWMMFNETEETCSSGNSDYRGYTKFLSSVECTRDLKYSRRLNSFSKQFFEETLDGTAEIVFIEPEEEEIVEDVDEELVGESDEELNLDESGDDIFADLFSGIDVGEETEIEEDNQGEDLSSEDVELTSIEGEEEEEELDEETVVQLIGGKKVLKLSDSKEYTQEVQEALDIMLDDGDINVVEDEIEEVVEEEIVEEDDGDIVFGNAIINHNVNTFIKGIFLSDVKDLLFATQIDSDDIGLSTTLLTIALNNFNQKMEVLNVGGNKVAGFTGVTYYNDLVSLILERFSSEVSINSSRKIIAKDISNVSFSLSSYTNKDLHDSIRESFRKKLILDIKKLDKDYSDLQFSGKKISDFLLKK